MLTVKALDDAREDLMTRYRDVIKIMTNRSIFHPEFDNVFIRPLPKGARNIDPVLGKAEDYIAEVTVSIIEDVWKGRRTILLRYNVRKDGFCWPVDETERLHFTYKYALEKWLDALEEKAKADQSAGQPSDAPVASMTDSHDSPS